MNTRIYYNDRFVELSNDNTDGDAYVFENAKSLSKRLDAFEQSEEKHLRIVHHDTDKLFDRVKECFKYIEAAGGLVVRGDGRVLIIKRRGKWDLPKGKAEKGEQLRQTALREVMEECSPEYSPTIIRELTHTYHTYHEKGKHILKHTAWYVMQYNGSETLHPQFAEDITHAVWFPENLLTVVRRNTYMSILNILDEWESSGHA